MTQQELFGTTLEEMQQALLPLGFKKFRAEQIFRWLYEKAASSFAEMTNLSKEQRTQLENNFTILPGQLKVVREQRSTDGLTTKVLLGFPDGNCVETVLMQHDYGYSVCVSSQVGCNMNCSFCASGLQGMVRNLTCGEILAQIYYFQHSLAEQGARVSRVVVMGSGEPMLNLEAVLQALQLLHADHGLGISYRNMTISTCGIIPGIATLIERGTKINLAISLHAPNDELRTELMPINKKYNYADVVEMAERYAQTSGRQVMYEYILIDKLNDSEEMARQLVTLLRRKLAVVNLIPANPVPEKGYRRPRPEAVNNFFQVLKKANINVTVRREMGKDIDAACGQLRAKSLQEK
ncbi:MAG: 23S rRNA (adenine(2503)-C(2))-methyltransferase RlmN [Acidaminococcaceae bacterium]|nr:23S rRNA (adenine(2503)-C(2))-methyltransferase RlmN [Acidaminococcaceae bacterium]